MALTVRGRDQRWLSTHRGITENPSGSNRDNRPDGITAAQNRLGAWLVGLPWCGTWAANGLLAAGVTGVSYRQASVALIEDDARAGRAPFRDWTHDHRRVLRGDLAVMFGRGVHVETVRGFKNINGQVYVVTEGGNTSNGIAGSQSNGGGSYKRTRPLSDVYGFARVDYPGGAVKHAIDQAATRLAGRAARADHPRDVDTRPVRIPASDSILLTALETSHATEEDPELRAFRDALTEAL